MEFHVVLVVREDELAADLPDVGLEFVFQAILLHVPQHGDFHRVGHEVGPDVVVEGDDHLGVQGLGHAQDVGGSHLVGDAARVFAVRTQGHVDLVLVAVLGVAIGVMRIAAVIEVAARRLDQIVDRHQIHVDRHLALGGLLLGQGDRHGAVKGFERQEFDVAHLDRIARLHFDDALGRNAPALPQVGAGFRADERYLGIAVLQHGGGDIHVDVVVMRMGRNDGVDLSDGKGIDDKGRNAQIRLQRDAAAHARHLVMRVHQRILHRTFAGAAPQVDADIGVAFGLDPDAGAGQPPHGEGAGLDHFAFDFFIEPGAPLRESAQNPRFFGDFINFCHFFLLSGCSG